MLRAYTENGFILDLSDTTKKRIKKAYYNYGKRNGKKIRFSEIKIIKIER